MTLFKISLFCSVILVLHSSLALADDAASCASKGLDYDNGINTCVIYVAAPWFAAGGGWNSRISMKNPATAGGLVVGYDALQFYSTNGSRIWAVISYAGQPASQTTAVQATLNPGGTFPLQVLDVCYEYTLCEKDDHNPALQAVRPLAGTIIIELTASDTSFLMNQYANIGDILFQHFPPGASSPDWKVSSPLWRLSYASTMWSGTLILTPSPQGRAQASATFDAVSLTNPFSIDEYALVILRDGDGNRVLQMTSPLLCAHCAIGKLLFGRNPALLSGSDLVNGRDSLEFFPWDTDLSAWKSPDGMFYGSVDVQFIPANGQQTAQGGIFMLHEYQGSAVTNKVVSPQLAPMVVVKQ